MNKEFAEGFAKGVNMGKDRASRLDAVAGRHRHRREDAGHVPSCRRAPGQASDVVIPDA